MQPMREAAANAGASAKAGMEKAKASMQEKVDKMKTRDPTEKEMARERKDLAEQKKQEARNQNATARQAGFAAGGFNRGDARGYGDYVNRGYTTTTTGTAYDASRRVGYNDNVGYTGDEAGSHAYSTTGNQGYPSGECQTRNWEEREPNNATRRNLGVTEDDPYYGSYE